MKIIEDLLKSKHLDVLLVLFIGILIYKIISLITKRSLEVMLKKADKGKRTTIISLTNNLIKYIIAIIIIILEIHQII